MMIILMMIGHAEYKNIYYKMVEELGAPMNDSATMGMFFNMSRISSCFIYRYK